MSILNEDIMQLTTIAEHNYWVTYINRLLFIYNVYISPLFLIITLFIIFVFLIHFFVIKKAKTHLTQARNVLTLYLNILKD